MSSQFPSPAPGDRFPLAVVARLSPPGDKPWDSGGWQVTDVLAGARFAATEECAPRPLNEELQLWPGLQLQVHVDEAESYYFNLAAERPQVFVVSREDDEDGFEPFLATLSFDEAAAYEEGEDRVWAVAMPPEVHRWLEQFVLAHFVPERRRKRKRDDWKDSTGSKQAHGQAR